ncbi:MAG: cache domain-containing protein [Haliscomenobacter sp.]|nr:cache domain-containing protein [Haliscomenobacter sp.]
MKKFYLRIVLPTILSMLLFILTIFLIIIPRYQQNIMDGKREMIMELTHAALSILSKYETDEREGILDREEAQRIAISRIQYLRYGDENKDYFWITDLHPTMIVHPFRNDLNGKDLTNFTDPHGKKLFVAFVEVVKKSEEGYVDYMWQWKDDSLHIVPKLSYVKIFKPWQWVIGTGVYIEDVKKEISALTASMVRISIGISIAIAVLLLYIFNQSINSERKRIEAEGELHKSREKFRTLVEAATEGLLMVMDGKISFSNSVISKMTGYESEELTHFPLQKMISNTNNKDIIDAFSGNTVREGKYELNLARKNGGLLEALVTSSKTEFYGKTVSILIVKDLSAEGNNAIPSVEYQKLISALDIGFFKATLHSKGTFIYANPTAIRMLGYDAFEELASVPVLALLSDPEERKNIRNQLLEHGFLKNKILRINTQNGAALFVAVSMVVVNKENHEDLICDGILEDITNQENQKIRFERLITDLQAKRLVLHRQVNAFIHPARFIDADATISDVLKSLSKSESGSVLLAKNGTDVLGIITHTDVQKRVYELELRLDNPAYMIMSSPVIYISENIPVADALRISESKNIHHLVVRNTSMEIKGVLRMEDIYREALGSGYSFDTAIQNAETADDLRKRYIDFRNFINPMVKSEVSARIITRSTTSFSDALAQKIIQMAIDEVGPPPVDFSFICLGSEGREEETLLTDQDNAIIYEDVPPVSERAVKTYFNALGEKICNDLHHAGYTFCPGNIMAKNPKWCGPLRLWEQYFTNWMALPEQQNLLDACVFFDFRKVYGSEVFTEKLSQLIAANAREYPLFLYHMANNTVRTKSEHLPAGILAEKNEDIVDLKNAPDPHHHVCKNLCPAGRYPVFQYHRPAYGVERPAFGQ